MMKKWLSLFIIISSFFISAARWNESIYSNPLKIAQAFLDTIIHSQTKKTNKYLVKRLHNNNHWVNATDNDRDNIFTTWVPAEFRQKRENFGYVIFTSPYGQIAVKFEKENGKWLWANE